MSLPGCQPVETMETVKRLLVTERPTTLEVGIQN